ncbi:hypothetical protein B0H16DRAFT_1778541 [Mycena metata]|uniref:Uncharacterized protein n=1 Tax=Mycena metata TaxID=1033252 RepID=A0AAD7HU51_9AGAR|nr:hypothetical protein B0H16DRAFT_1778541 [Mycena metata]
MHHCLKIIEIVDIICDNIDPRVDGETSSTAGLCELAVFARTCTTFSGPALVHLWRTTTLERLLAVCMPIDLWEIEADPPRSRRWDFTGAQRLSPGNTVSKSTESDLASRRRRIPPYPHFLRPTLTSLSFDLYSDSAASLLAILPTKCPRITKLRVYSSVYRSRSLSELVLVLGHPEEITAPFLDPDVLEHLSHQSTLRYLSLAASWNAVAPFLSKFTVDLFDLVTAVEMHDLLAGIGIAFSRTSLMHIAVYNRCQELINIHPDSTTHLIPHRELQVLKPFTNLTELHIGSPLGFDLDDGAVLDLVPTWPRLRSCSFAASFPTHRPRTTLTPSQFRSTPPLFRRSTWPGPHGQHPLTRLEVKQSPVALTAGTVARFISTVFPKLRRITTGREYENNDEADLEDDDLEGLNAIRNHLCWKAVQTLLPTVHEG